MANYLDISRARHWNDEHRAFSPMTVSQIIVWIIVGGLAGTLAGRVVTFKKAGLGRWMNFLVGIIGAFLGGGVFKRFRIGLGFGNLKVTCQPLASRLEKSISGESPERGARLN